MSTSGHSEKLHWVRLRTFRGGAKLDPDFYILAFVYDDLFV
jgi:hypothetical protein